MDNIERQKRSRNVCIQNVPESKLSSTKEKQEEDMNTITELLQVRCEDVERVFRAGAIKDTPRALIVVMSSPDIAKRAHNYGRGKPIRKDGDGEILYWVNPDLIKTDRVANFKARQLRKSSSNVSM